MLSYFLSLSIKCLIPLFTFLPFCTLRKSLFVSFSFFFFSSKIFILTTPRCLSPLPNFFSFLFLLIAYVHSHLRSNMPGFGWFPTLPSWFVAVGRNFDWQQQKFKKIPTCFSVPNLEKNNGLVEYVVIGPCTFFFICAYFFR